MNIIIGLGNPGKKFENTRHNAGFMALNKFAEKNSFPEFKLQKKYNSLISEKPFDSAQGDENIILVKPQTFMNKSGKAVREITKNRDVKLLVVLQDDIDLPLGKIKIVQERGSAGHKGVESIIESIGNKDLIRIRIGIASDKKVQAEEIVLKNFSGQDQDKINQAIEQASECLNALLKQGLKKAMNEFNK